MKMADKEKVFDMTMERMVEIRKAVSEFKDTVASQVKDLKVDVKDWRFGVESTEDGVIIDISLKLLLKPKPEPEAKPEAKPEE
jgi:hypothetical protein